jgi:hypothetical protein
MPALTTELRNKLERVIVAVCGTYASTEELRQGDSHRRILQKAALSNHQGHDE